MRIITLFSKPWLLSTFILLSTAGFAQVKEEWAARYNGPGHSDDRASTLAVDKDGNVYVTGTSRGGETGEDFATIKYNSAGMQQWVARYNGPGNSNDGATALAVDASGNVYVTGASTGIGTLGDYTTIKYNTNGVQQWVARYNGAGGATALAVDASGNVYVTGNSLGSVPGFDYTTIKYNAAGVQQWVAIYNGPANGFDGASALAVDASGNVYVTGRSKGLVGEDDFFALDYATIKYNVNGVQQWAVRYNGPGNGYDFANALALDADGNVYVTGASVGSEIVNGYAVTDIATIKYDSDGNTKWLKRYNGPGNTNDNANAIAVDAKGNVYVTGVSNNEPFFDPGDPSASEFATIKYDASGNELWVATYNGPEKGFEGANALALDTSGNVYVTGGSKGIVGVSDEALDYATIKYNTNGVQQWEARYNGDGKGIDESNAIAVDINGNIYVTGFSRGSENNLDYATIKYSQHFCGNKGDKVLVCHKGHKTLCISGADVPDHISHGDQLGECVVEEGRVAADRSQLSARSNELPDRFRVFNAPNPVATATKIYYELPVDGHVSIKVYDMLGREITKLVDADRKSGYHNTEYNAAALQKGFYFYRITVKTINKTWVQTEKISVVK